MRASLREHIAAVGALARIGLLDPAGLIATTAAAAKWGTSSATPYVAAARRFGDRVAMADDERVATYAELDERSTIMAGALADAGLGSEHRIGLLCRNHVGFVESLVAVGKLGSPLVLLNTEMAYPQLREVIRREGITATLHDHGFDASELEETPVAIDDLRNRTSTTRVRPNRRAEMPVLLTSGTTGTPKGARRGRPRFDLVSSTGLLQRIPFRSGDRCLVAAPLFHAWGSGILLIAATTASTVVVRSSSRPDTLLETIEDEGITVLATVPVVLQRLLAAGIDARDTSSLRVVATSGSALPASLGTRWMDVVGDNLYNMYGSTEVGPATLADPSDLRAAPGTAGPAFPGTTLVIVDADGQPVPEGTSGRIFVANPMAFAGYTGGGNKETIDGAMSTGDVGYVDEGRLFVTGRADDMIVSGGENVFPAEIEDLLLGHPRIADAAVVGVDDPEFGQRLRAYVVRTPRSRLSAEAVREHVRSQLARYKVPRDVVFVDEIPRNPAGKILRAQL